MFQDIMCDPQLRGSAEILVHVTRPLHKQYKEDLDSQTAGHSGMLEWSAQRSLASTQKTVLDIFKSQASQSLFDALRLQHCSPPLDYDTNSNDISEDIALTLKAYKFAVHLSGNYAWSEMLHQYTLPLAASALLASKRQDRRRAMKHLKKLINAVVAAEQEASTNKALQACLNDVAFPDEPMAREIMVLLKRGDFSLESNETSEVQLAMTKFNAGSSSTKEILESTFAHFVIHCGSFQQEQGCFPQQPVVLLHQQPLCCGKWDVSKGSFS